MSWTIMPAVVTARAWTDDEFRQRLLEQPERALAETLHSRPPAGVSVVENTSETPYLPLPVRPADITDDALRELLDYEIGSDKTFEWSLPAHVIERALRDADFRRALLDDAETALTGSESDPPAGLRVLANEPDRFWLVLRRRPIEQGRMTPEEVVQVLHLRFGGDTVLGTTQCCAGGTTT
jgi:hypothetical protein